MDFLLNPITWFVLGLALFFGEFIYCRYSRYTRLKILKDLGFKVTSKISPELERKLRAIAPKYMENPHLIFGRYATDKGLLVWWHGKYTNNGLEVHCWCFRKAERRVINYYDKWWQAIYVDGLDKHKRNELIKAARLLVKKGVEITEEGEFLLFVYRKPVLFADTVSIIEGIVKNT